MAYSPTEWTDGEPIRASNLNKAELGIKSANDSYVPTEWHPGDLITAERLNKMEDGIANAGGGAGGGEAPEKDVNFIDYDGTILYSYTAQEFAALDALPTNPTHEGLTAQGWNWELADAKTYVASNGMLWIGQMYTTSDGKTHVYVRLTEERKSPRVRLYVNGTAEIDWGDESETTTLTGTSLSTFYQTSDPHNYAHGGDYVITITVTGQAAFCGYSGADGGGYLIRGENNNTTCAYRNAVTKIETGDNVVQFKDFAFRDYWSLQYITIPSTVASFGQFVFYNNYSLKSAVLPKGTTLSDSNIFSQCSSMNRVSLCKGITGGGFVSAFALTSVSLAANPGQSVLNKCYALTRAAIPPDATSIGQYAFQYCEALQKIVIPASVTGISAYAFAYCYSMKEIHFKASTPPTVANSNAWTSIPSDCKIYVPTGSLSAYTSASNYPSSSTYTYTEE